MATEPLQLPASAGQAPALPEQPLLFSEIEIEEKLEKEGRYTAARLKTKHPRLYDTLVAILEVQTVSDDGAPGLRKLAELFGLHHRTIAAVRDQNTTRLDTARSKTVKDLRLAASLQIERLIEHPESLPITWAAGAAVQMLEKAELLDNRATHRTEVVTTEDPALAYQALMARLEAKERQLGPGEAREIGSIGGETGSHKTLADQAPADLESGDPGDHPQVTGEIVTTEVTSPAANMDARPERANADADTPPGGGCAIEHPATTLSDTVTNKISEQLPQTDQPPAP